MNSNSNINLENLYPVIYKELYPFVVDGVNELMRAGKVTVESIDRMADDIIFKCGLWDEDGDNSVYGFDPWFNSAEASADNARAFSDAEFVMARPQPQRHSQQNRPSQRHPQRLRHGGWINRGNHNRNTLRDLLKILILREILGA